MLINFISPHLILDKAESFPGLSCGMIRDQDFAREEASKRDVN